MQLVIAKKNRSFRAVFFDIVFQGDGLHEDSLGPLGLRISTFALEADNLGGGAESTDARPMSGHPPPSDLQLRFIFRTDKSMLDSDNSIPGII